MFCELDNKKSLAELQSADLPVMTAELLGVRVKDGVELDQDTIEFLEDINEYLSAFVAPNISEVSEGTEFMFGKMKCIACGNSLGGMLGCFRWGIAHGEGHCACGYPARALHYIKDRNGKDCFNRPPKIILQYHPSVLSKRSQQEELEE